MNIPYKTILLGLLSLIGVIYNQESDSILTSAIKYIFSAVDKYQVIQNVFNAAVEEDCLFKCPSGTRPIPKKNHIPTSNGCGALSLTLKSDYLPFAAMENCCNSHDICYDTCNRKKDACDDEFKRCLYKICNKYKIEAVVTACKGTAKMLHTGTLALGCKFYLDSQKDACHCSSASNYWESKQEHYRSDKHRNEF